MNRLSIDWYATVAQNGRRSSLLLIAASLLCFLPGFFSMPPVDRDEALYAQASRQMVESGDWVDIRLQGEPRHKQPAGIYWAQSVFVCLLGDDGIAPIWVHRLPSLIGAVASVLLTYWVALPLVGAGPALLAGLLMAGSVILGVEARLAKTDATLLATILAAQGVLARAYLSEKPDQPDWFSGRYACLLPSLFWMALGAGSIVKGPLILLFVGLTALTLAITERSATFLSRLKPLHGILIFLAIVLPWYLAIGFRTEGQFYENAIGFNIVGKISQGHEGHGAPPLVHFAWFWGIFWPGSIVFALSLSGLWKRRKEAWVRFLICWTIPSWVIFELIVTKLPHYLLPTFPAIAIGAAGIITSRQMIAPGFLAGRVVRSIMIVVSIVSLSLVAGLAWIAAGRTLSPSFILVALLMLLAFGLLFRWALKSLAEDRIPNFIASQITSMILFYSLSYPTIARLPVLWPGPALATLIESRTAGERPFLISAGYTEPSLVFHTRTDLVMANGSDAARQLAGKRGAIAIVEEAQLPDFLKTQQEIKIMIEEIGTVSAWNIGGGDKLNLTVFTTH